MDRTVIATDAAPAPAGQYSQAIKAGGTMIFAAGQIAADPKTGRIVGETVEEQAHQVLQNARAVLRAAGADLTDVVKTTVFLADINDFKAMNGVYAQYFPDKPPARSAVGGLQLPGGVKVEIECIAMI
jgi:2-iminobutanoate/2-iminopropanoate deaminase